jgi:Cu(I)/Ag(I) efflux system protein CusF
MKRLFAVVALSVTAASAGYAQMKGMDMKDMPIQGMESGKQAQGQSHKGTAVVKKVDRAAGKVSLAHDPIKSMDWPAMTMTFTVKDKALLEKLAPGRKVEFEFLHQGSDYVITSVK